MGQQANNLRCHRCNRALEENAHQSGVCPHCLGSVARSLTIDRKRLSEIPHPHLTRWAFALVVGCELIQTAGLLWWFGGGANGGGSPAAYASTANILVWPWVGSRIAWTLVSLTLLRGELSPFALPATIGNTVLWLPGVAILTWFGGLGDITAALCLTPMIWVGVTMTDYVIGRGVTIASGGRPAGVEWIGCLAIMLTIGGFVLPFLGGPASAAFAFGGWQIYLMLVFALYAPLSLIRSGWVWWSLRSWRRTQLFQSR